MPWRGSRVPDVPEVGGAPRPMSGVTPASYEIGKEVDVPTCGTGPAGRYLFVFKELARLWRRPRSGGRG